MPFYSINHRVRAESINGSSSELIKYVLQCLPSPEISFLPPSLSLSLSSLYFLSFLLSLSVFLVPLFISSLFFYCLSLSICLCSLPPNSFPLPSNLVSLPLNLFSSSLKTSKFYSCKAHHSNNYRRHDYSKFAVKTSPTKPSPPWKWSIKNGFLLHV